MIELKLLGSKETDKKLRWAENKDGTGFALSIPKWRIPEPVPMTLRVDIEECRLKRSTPRFSKRHIQEYPVLKTTPIICLVGVLASKAGNPRYLPAGIEPEISGLSIPPGLTDSNTRHLVVVVHWGLSLWMMKGRA
jgi:hypothetical protein